MSPSPRRASRGGRFIVRSQVNQAIDRATPQAASADRQDEERGEARTATERRLDQSTQARDRSGMKHPVHFASIAGLRPAHGRAGADGGAEHRRPGRIAAYLSDHRTPWPTATPEVGRLVQAGDRLAWHTVRIGYAGVAHSASGLTPSRPRVRAGRWGEAAHAPGSQGRGSLDDVHPVSHLDRRHRPRRRRAAGHRRLVPERAGAGPGCATGQCRARGGHHRRREDHRGRARPRGGRRTRPARAADLRPPPATPAGPDRREADRARGGQAEGRPSTRC